MSITKFTNGAAAGNPDNHAEVFAVGKAYIASGSYDSKTDFETAFADLTAMATELVKFDEFGDLADKPYKIDSKVEKLKTLHRIIEGKRTNSVTINFNGMSDTRKEFIESELNKQDATIIMVNKDENAVKCFNGLRFLGQHNGEGNALYNAVIEAEFSGSSYRKIWTKLTIPEAT